MQVVISHGERGESILVFLPRINKLSKYYRHLVDELKGRNIVEFFSVFILHSQVPMDEQKGGFRDPAPEQSARDPRHQHCRELYHPPQTQSGCRFRHLPPVGVQQQATHVLSGEAVVFPRLVFPEGWPCRKGV